MKKKKYEMCGKKITYERPIKQYCVKCSKIRAKKRYYEVKNDPIRHESRLKSVREHNQLRQILWNAKEFDEKLKISEEKSLSLLHDENLPWAKIIINRRIRNLKLQYKRRGLKLSKKEVEDIRNNEVINDNKQF